MCQTLEAMVDVLDESKVSNTVYQSVLISVQFSFVYQIWTVTKKVSDIRLVTLWQLLLAGDERDIWLRGISTHMEERNGERVLHLLNLILSNLLNNCAR